MDMFNLSKVKNIIIINKEGETIHRFLKNYLEPVENIGKSFYRKHNALIHWLPIAPKKIRKYRIMDCFIWDGDLYILDTFVKFEWIASNTMYGLERFHAVKIFKWTLPELGEQIVADCYAYISERRPEKIIVERKVNELADKGIAISANTLAQIMKYYNLVEKRDE